MHVMAAASSGGSAAAAVLIILVVVFVAVPAYFAPTILAWVRHVPNAGSVTVINTLFGWSVIGWGVALAMACRSLHQPPVSVTAYAAVAPSVAPQAPQPGTYPQPEAGRP